jgi:hypothetical protein
MPPRRYAIPASLANQPRLRVAAFATVLLTLRQLALESRISSNITLVASYSPRGSASRFGVSPTM